MTCRLSEPSCLVLLRFGKELEETFRTKLPKGVLGQGYGMAEAGPVLALCLAFAKELTDVKSGSCGSFVRNAELKIVDPDMGASCRGTNLERFVFEAEKS